MSGIKISETTPLFICHKSDDRVLFLIAACFLLKIPFISVHEEFSENDANSLKKQLNPAAVFSDSDTNFDAIFEADKISITNQQLCLKSEYIENSFSLYEPDDTAGLFLTSGSTGVPKIVPIKRRQVLFASRASADNFQPGVNKYWLLCLPLNHVGGISIILRSLLYGSAIYRIDSFEADKVSRLLSDHRDFEVASMVPTMLINMMDDTGFQTHSNFKAILLGGGPISQELIEWASTRGIPIVTSYGMTETFAQIAANPILQPRGMYFPKNSVGTLFQPNSIEIRDEDGNIQHTRESGQIWLKGPQIFDGYLDEELNEMVFDNNGWFKTGDYGYLNHRKQLFVETRRTDLIITGGENVNPPDVEQIMDTYPGIARSAVVGVHDIKWGQRVVAFYEEKDNVDIHELRNFLKKKLLAFQVPKEFIKLKKIPVTSLGKIKRKELIRLYKV
ncbi:AMP-binding protein [Rhodohalobacter halophilus]|uniref:AMP-binding protein n=1 Tax=Rhodohalobacter halophilus TaxID=1812810 RepID=UPI00114D1951|nr:AMP-binding protein [Rhodohalobacter halophilus]